MSSSHSVFSPSVALSGKKSAYERALSRLSDILLVEIKKPMDIVKTIDSGLSPDSFFLIVNVGFNKNELEWVISPKTLKNRIANHQLLTSEETGKLFRAGKIYSLALEVLGNEEKAMRWLHRPRKIFSGKSAMELMKNEAGAQLVEDELSQLDSGYLA